MVVVAQASPSSSNHRDGRPNGRLTFGLAVIQFALPDAEPPVLLELGASVEPIDPITVWLHRRCAQVPKSCPIFYCTKCCSLYLIAFPIDSQMIGKRARHRPSAAAGYSSTRMGGAGGVSPRNGGEICMALVVVAAAACASSAAAASTSPAFCSTMPQSAPFLRNRGMVPNSATTAGGISQKPSFVGMQQISTTSNARPGMHPLFSSLDGDDANFDESEWQAVTAALQMYKAAYGDLKVPSRFVVPSLPPWPGEFRRRFWLFCAIVTAIFSVTLSQKDSPDDTHEILIYRNSHHRAGLVDEAWTESSFYPFYWKVRARQ